MLIGEVSRRSGVSTRMLRHYDAIGLVQPTARTSGGYREYATADIRRLFQVECLRTLGLSLGDAKRALDEPDFAPAELVGALIEHTKTRIAAEEELLRKLERVDTASQWGDVMGTIALLRELESESGARRQQAVLAQHERTPLPVDALVEAALSEDDPNVAGALRWSLARGAGEGLAALAGGLASESVEVRRRAAAAIAEIPTTEATTLLKTALTDCDVAVRDRAALTIGMRRVAEAVPALLRIVIEGRSDVEAAEVLGLLADDPTVSEGIMRAMQDKLDATVDASMRLRITQALAEIPGARARDLLAELARDGDRTVAGTAAAILRL
ncbi:MerR family DNA-binding transcriptional regulator [Rhodococcus sp. H36-A4]|uniref:MerR family transcriptional regulator n=1 Tax=Rhodococcus sp. H36-A4 TaxID=3004353 RepID=UPI0022B01782|nr:MerR family DNA-binding transcriptional regulator [Rhodococcus sp. H36-A4]MCZ4077239.1 MerR family DNA-binding transcriptional regulator [Rhodococcus sp. H36-A4]